MVARKDSAAFGNPFMACKGSTQPKNYKN